MAVTCTFSYSLGISLCLREFAIAAVGKKRSRTYSGSVRSLDGTPRKGKPCSTYLVKFSYVSNAQDSTVSWEVAFTCHERETMRSDS